MGTVVGTGTAVVVGTGTAVAVLDLTAIGQNVSVEQWYGGLLRRAGFQLDPSGAVEEAQC